MNNLNELITAADNGDIDAILEVADYIVWGDETRDIEPELLEKAVEYLHTAIENGSDTAMNSLGAMYYKGRGVEQDYSKAVYWYTEAANKGNVTSAIWDIAIITGATFLLIMRKHIKCTQKPLLWVI